MPARLRRDRKEGRKGTKGKKKMSRGKKAVITVVTVLVLALAAGGAYAAYFVSQVNKKIAPANKDRAKIAKALTPANETEPYYVLLLGSDTRDPGQSARSDTIMLCRMNPKNKEVSILSIPRDTKIDLPGYGTQKINAAMAYGGPSGAITAVSNFVGVPISHYVEIDFGGFTNLINAMGGVTLDVPVPAYYQGVSVPAGRQTLNGTQALTFVRDRHTYALGDFQRAANQRTLLKAVAKQMLQASPAQIPGLLQSFTSCVTTDMSSSEILNLAMAFRGMNADTDIYSGQVPSTTTTISGASYVLPVDSQWATVRANFTTGIVPFVSADNQPDVKQ